MPISTLTYRYRVKDRVSGKHLQTMALAVQPVWNDCREGCMQAWPRHRGWLRGFDLVTLMAGSSKLPGLPRIPFAKDWTHKVTTDLVRGAKAVRVGHVPSSRLGKTRLAKSVYDAGWHQLRAVADRQSQ